MGKNLVEQDFTSVEIFSWLFSARACSFVLNISMPLALFRICQLFAFLATSSALLSAQDQSHGFGTLSIFPSVRVVLPDLFRALSTGLLLFLLANFSQSLKAQLASGFFIFFCAVSAFLAV